MYIVHRGKHILQKDRGSISSRRTGESIPSARTAESISSARTGERISSARIGESILSARTAESTPSARTGESILSGRTGQSIPSARTKDSIPRKDRGNIFTISTNMSDMTITRTDNIAKIHFTVNHKENAASYLFMALKAFYCNSQLLSIERRIRI